MRWFDTRTFTLHELSNPPLGFTGLGTVYREPLLSFGWRCVVYHVFICLFDVVGVNCSWRVMRRSVDRESPNLDSFSNYSFDLFFHLILAGSTRMRLAHRMCTK